MKKCLVFPAAIVELPFKFFLVLLFLSLLLVLLVGCIQPFIVEIELEENFGTGLFLIMDSEDIPPYVLVIEGQVRNKGNFLNGFYSSHSEILQKLIKEGK